MIRSCAYPMAHLFVAFCFANCLVLATRKTNFYFDSIKEPESFATTRSRADPLGPGKGSWKLESPAAYGISADDLEMATSYLYKESTIAPRSCFLVAKDGALILENYSDAEGAEETHMVMSVTKTLGAMLMGWAQSRGLLDIDADITRYGQNASKPYPVTTRQIMSQIANRGPGEKWVYDGVGGHIISLLPQIFRNATGQDPTTVWKKEFVEPLGL